jgi:hypothetical protein
MMGPLHDQASPGAVSPAGRIAPVIRWTARVSAALLFGLVLLFMLGEGLPPLMRAPLAVRLLFAAHLATLAGLLLLWRWELLGGILTIGGMLAFYAINYCDAGTFPSGWFPLFYIPGVLSLISWSMTRARRPIGQSP